jgi:hypothetical protein
MLLPTKTLSPTRSLLGVGASILRLLDEPKPVSRLWDEFKRRRSSRRGSPTITFGWFVLALDVLFALGLIHWDHGRIAKRQK